jgi:hypothetical protein
LNGAAGGTGDFGNILESLTQLELGDGNEETDEDKSNLRRLEDRSVSPSCRMY